jgi:hypothetical protein
MRIDVMATAKSISRRAIRNFPLNLFH